MSGAAQGHPGRPSVAMDSLYFSELPCAEGGGGREGGQGRKPGNSYSDTLYCFDSFFCTLFLIKPFILR